MVTTEYAERDKEERREASMTDIAAKKWSGGKMLRAGAGKL
jgi:hypothetical protein